VGALANVELRDRIDALGLECGTDRQRITGVRVLSRADSSAAETLQADLVVCATGRGARTPAWLEALGHPRPVEQRVAVDVRYSTRHLRLPAGALDGDKLVLVGPRPELPRTLFLFVQENGRWIATLGGYGPANRPPDDPDGWLAFAASVAAPEVAEALRAAEPLDEIATHAFPAGTRRRYERTRLPSGLLVCGDALCAFNPIYGQGMTVAAAEACALRDCLANGQRDLAPRFFAAARPAVDHAWRLATGADLALPDVPGARPLGVRVINAYLRRLRGVAEHDPAVAGAFIAVVGMREPPGHVLRPATAMRVLRGPRPNGWREPVATVRHSELRIGEINSPLREAGPADAEEAVVFVHGNPGSSADWEPLMAAIGARRRAVAWDAPGFGRTRTPAGFAQTVNAHAAFIGEALQALGIERAHLVLHDFGGPWGLRWAAGDPARFASAVLLGTGVTPGYRWHALARAWRTPRLGELLMAATTRSGFRLMLRRNNPRGLPPAFVDRMYDDFDRHTRQAVLRLYRSLADVAAAGETLATALRPLDRPALVLWGRHDPYLPATLAARQRDAFPHAEVHVLERSGHWPFIDDPATVTAALTAFLATHAGAPPHRVPDRAAPLRSARR
jgi:pimeloyl-ACP methyl ester carboxylesterase/2-polyprenyl-6-methoxyphenol hydroxylase-like FAD-dependent oxidoreductase